MPQINHMRRWIQPRDGKKDRVKRPDEPLFVSSIIGSIDPDFDDLASTEEYIVSQLRGRGTI